MDSSPKITIVCSHNNRIQKFLKANFGLKSEGKVRFMNCAVLKIIIDPLSKEKNKYSVNISLLYQGDSNTLKENEPYYAFTDSKS